jgi:hypothetical protein
VRRCFLVLLTVLVLWTVGYLAYVISSTVRATGPAEPRVVQDAGEQ